MKRGILRKRLLPLAAAVLCIGMSACQGGQTASQGDGTDMQSELSAPTASTLPDNSGNVPAAATIGDASFQPGAYFTDKYPRLEFRKEGDSQPLAVWWWNLHRIIAPDDNGVTVDMALDMLLANHVNEIYLDIGAMMPWASEDEQGGLTEADREEGFVSELEVRGFVKKCSKLGIRVAALGGSSGNAVLGWLDPKYNMVHMKQMVQKVEAYNADCQPDEKFYAVHFDVEPYTESKYGDNRDLRNQWTADLVIAARDECDRIGVELGWDIWAWSSEDDLVTDRDGKQVNILDVYARECQTLAVMAYTNTAQGQFERGTDLELAYAKKYNTTLIVASEYTKGTPTSTTYYFSPREEAIEQNRQLRALIDADGYPKLGGAIHHLRSFWEYMTAGVK